MLPVALIAIAAIALAVPLLGWSLFSGGAGANRAVQTNLTRGLVAGVAARKQREPRFQALTSRLTPGRSTARLERLLGLAGRPSAWPLKRLMAAKIVGAGSGVVLGVLMVAAAPGTRTILLAVFLAVGAYFVPDALLYGKGTERQKAIGQELPDTLDQMTIAVEAGLGFEAAMARAGHNGKGPLAEELVRTLQEMQLGRSRAEAYRSLAERTTVQDLRRFVAAVLQADAYGVSIARVLRTQAGEMRLKRRQRAEEKAMQLPVKVLFPLMFCIMPVLFIVLLGPAALNVMDAFSK